MSHLCAQGTAAPQWVANHVSRDVSFLPPLRFEIPNISYGGR